MRELVENLIKSDFKGHRVWRYDFYGRRIYFNPETGREYSGLTGAMSACTMKGDQEEKQLSKWRDKFIDTHGQQGYKDFLDATADFGSLIHYGLIRIKEDGFIDWKEWNDFAQTYFEGFYKSKGLELDQGVIQSQVFESCKHMASLLQWVYERVDEIKAVEVACMWEDYSICTPVDIVALCRATPKAKPEWTTVNIKTSSQISQKQLDQSSIENYMWNQTYDLHCPATGILRTKDWRTTPSYEYKSADYIGERVDEWSRKFAIGQKYFNRPAVVQKFTGITKLGESPIIESLNLKQYHENFEK